MRFSRHEDNEVTMRALLNSVEAGIMIGKGGSTIAHARTLGVKAGVSKQMEASDDDRVVTISGPLSKVVQAFMFLLEQVVAKLQTSTVTLRLLVSHLVMGSVIGRQGAHVHHIRDASGIDINCGKTLLPQSTERIVELCGPIEGMERAIMEIGLCIGKDKDKMSATIYYNPEKIVPSLGVDFATRIVKHITVPEDNVGRVIGKGGQKISEIRRVTMCDVVIHEKNPEAHERVITINGSYQQTEKAVSLISRHLKIEEESKDTMNETHDLIDLSDY